MAEPEIGKHATSRTGRAWRFSLRTLLIVLTLACIGAWYWFRVPFVVESERVLAAATPADRPTLQT